MKRISLYSIITGLFILSTLSGTLSAQQEDRRPKVRRASRMEKTAEKQNTLSVRAQNHNLKEFKAIDDAPWMRIVYRELEFENEKNAPLYYPINSTSEQENLFTILFKRMNDKVIDVYEYIDGYEAFDEEHRVDLKEFMDRFYIIYETNVSRGDTTFVVNENDIPASEIKSYYLKEAWFFDRENSVFDVKIIALCPIFHRMGDFGEVSQPAFWVPYEEIRPYINQKPVMISNTNNAKRMTLDDFMRHRLFEGKIIKTQNLKNQSLAEYCPTPDSLKMERQRIEKQLSGFKENLWATTVKVDSVSTDTKSEEKQAKVRASKTRDSRSSKSVKKVKAPKVKKAKKSTPTRSVRRRR